ncbi:zinc ribbon domain-containing protein [Paraliobacillus sediminis]|uniref:zinc ribbon domain-containing protein n=1 Tax=Paraliobacillus sediminis TaxID=1885916 RepID=UPI000E3E629E|nr:zinc ribbon domain-containing protein [Paraliobacillus sediminis]
MHCTKCGHPLSHEEKFCSNCGKPASDDIAATTETANLEVTAVATSTNETNENQFMESVKEISSGYISTLKDAVVKPYHASKQVIEADKTNGLITLILFALLFPLHTYINLLKGWSTPSFWGAYLLPVLFTSLIFAAFIVIVFGVVKLMKVEKVSLFLITAKFGLLMILPTAAMLIAVFSSLISATFLGVMLSSFSLMLVSIAAIVSVFSASSQPSNDKGLDIYYSILLMFIAMSVVISVLGASIIANALEQIGGGFLPY